MEKPRPLKMLVNLLPPEVVLLKRQSSKIILVNRLSIGALLVLAFLTSSIFVIRFLQDTSLIKTQQGIALAQSEIGELRDKEGYAVALKNRLNSVQMLMGDQKKITIFNKVVSQLPADSQVSVVSIEKNDTMVLTAVSTNSYSMDTLLANLASKDGAGDLISKVELESMSRGRDGIYRYSFRIFPK